MRFAALAVLICWGLPFWVLVTVQLLVGRVLRPTSFSDKRLKDQERTKIRHASVPGISHETVSSRGLNIHVARAGISPSKRLILFLHGWPEFWYSWRAQLTALQQDFEVAAIDLPGFNASDAPAARSGYVTGDLCKIIAGVVQALGRESCHVVAHDWGGALAFDLAGMFPEMVERLVVLSCVPGRLFAKNMDLGQMMRSWYMYVFAAPMLPELMIRRDDFATIGEIFTKVKAGGPVQNSLKDQEVQLYKDALALPGRLTASLNYYRAMIIDDGILRRNVDAYAARRQQLHMPVLVALGDQDNALSPNLLSRIGTVIPNADVRIIPRCSHWMQQDCPDLVNDLVCRFLSKEA